MEFWVKATWDSDSGVFVSESNIKGLHLEAETLREFQDEMLRIAPELIIDNHGDEEPEKTRARDMPITEAFGLMASNLYNVIYNMLRESGFRSKDKQRPRNHEIMTNGTISVSV